ncbi:acyl carrier protein [Streptococcus pneumoniae]|nr:acyl carrier protein [Streptococcus pneumoniae]
MIDATEVQINRPKKRISEVDLMEFILTLEDEFSIEISDEEIDQLQNVGDVVKIIQGK